jgi:hypothetical protein
MFACVCISQLLFLANWRDLPRNDDYFTKFKFLYNLLFDVFSELVVLILDEVLRVINNHQ